MQIPPFPLPSNVATVIEFRVPTVEDGLLFCDLNEAQEEANATRYLNHMQDTRKRALSDSGLWSGEDRRTALWWIYLATHESGVNPFTYQCQCGEKHVIDFDMHSLMDTTTALVELPSNDIHLTISGKEYKAKVSPLNGYAVEHIEMLRNERDQFDSASREYHQASNDMAINELAHCLTFSEQPEDNNAALIFKLDLIKSMFVSTEFKAACIKVESKLRESRHGLLTKYEDGIYYLVATIKECDELIKKGGEATRTLLLPFHSNQFIATF